MKIALNNQSQVIITTASADITGSDIRSALQLVKENKQYNALAFKNGIIVNGTGNGALTCKVSRLEFNNFYIHGTVPALISLKTL